MNSVIPNAPKGTYFAVISPRKSLLQRSDPSARPTENVVKNRVTTCSFEPITFFARLGNCDRKVAPTSQNHEIPRIVMRMSRREHATRTMDQVSAKTFGFNFSPGAAASARGM